MNRQAQLAGQTSGIVSNATNDISNMIQQTFQNRQRAQDRTAERFDRYIRGTEVVRDPQTGQQLEVQSGADQYYRREGTNQVLGAPAGAEPSPRPQRNLPPFAADRVETKGDPGSFGWTEAKPGIFAFESVGFRAPRRPSSQPTRLQDEHNTRFFS